MSAKALMDDPTWVVQPGRFKYFVLAMTLGVVGTTILGIVMAFIFARRKWLVVACLVGGVLLPAWLYYG